MAPVDAGGTPPVVNASPPAEVVAAPAHVDGISSSWAGADWQAGESNGL